MIGEDNHLELSRPVIDMAVAQKGQLQQMRRTTEELMRQLSRITTKLPRKERSADGRLVGVMHFSKFFQCFYLFAEE